MRQLRHIHDYIAQDSPLYARRVGEELVRKTMDLEQMPRIGRKVAELNEDAVREIGVYSYRILYELKNDGNIDVLAVIHKRRHLEVYDISRT